MRANIRSRRALVAARSARDGPRPEATAKIAASKRACRPPEPLKDAAARLGRKRRRKRGRSCGPARSGAGPPKAGRPWTTAEDAAANDERDRCARATGRTLIAVYKRWAVRGYRCRTRFKRTAAGRRPQLVLPRKTLASQPRAAIPNLAPPSVVVRGHCRA